MNGFKFGAGCYAVSCVLYYQRRKSEIVFAHRLKNKLPASELTEKNALIYYNSARFPMILPVESLIWPIFEIQKFSAQKPE